MHPSRHLISALLAWTCGTAMAAETELTMERYGPVQIGMNVTEAYAELKQLKGKGVANPKDVAPEGCDYYRPFAGLAFLTQGRAIIRIETSDSEAVTPFDIRVGDPVAKVRARFGQRLKEDPLHPGTLTVQSLDGKTAMRFEAGEQVKEIYAGYKHAISRSKSCS